MSRVLILDGMWNKSLAAVRSLGARGVRVTVGERTRLATALFSRYCRRRMTYPSPCLHPRRFLDALENELKTYDYDVVLPMEFSTQVLLTRANHRERLEKHSRIPFPPSGLAETLNDKAFVMKHAIDMGIDVPETYFFDSVEEVMRNSDRLAYPVLIKPRASSGSRGIRCVREKSQLMPAYLKVHEEYPFPIIQERIPAGGEAYGVGMLLNFQSEMRAAFVYKRIREYPVSGGPSTLRESVEREDVRLIAESLLRSLNWIGIAHVEFKVDPRDGKPKLLEINPRFWGSLQLAIEAGVDFPYLLYRMAMDGDVDQVMEYRAGVRCRWLIPGDMLHFLANPKRLKLQPSFFDFGVKDDIMSFQDPLPTIGRLLSVITLFSDKEMRKIIAR